MNRKTTIIVILIAVTAATALFLFSPIDIPEQLSLSQEPVYAVPETSASAVTSPPSSMDGINMHPEVYGTGADSDMITLGPKTGGCEGCPPYPGKTSMEFEVPHGTPVLAPIDMVFIGFNNRNAEYRLRDDGEVQSPYDDLELSFISASTDWPGMIICVYHLSTSPLLTEHIEGSDCYSVEKWGSTTMADGRQFFEHEEIVFKNSGNAESCGALMGRLVKRGQVIGYAGSVGDHSMAPFRFKVSHTEVNPTVRIGNKHLHWVQPGSFFYWKCYSSEAVFPEGVLAYPFPCEGYVLPAEQYSVGFKYSEN